MGVEGGGCGCGRWVVGGLRMREVGGGGVEGAGGGGWGG